MKKMLFALVALTAVAANLNAGHNCGCECPPVCQKDVLITEVAPVRYNIHKQYVCPADCNTPHAVLSQKVVASAA
ncbi:hypothetical protein A3F66_00700 [candidate division TM6 bacterium RIFCSPHIGHO2_12_FULL_32_22]|nr:MAG: hypothetical protein A3F66_00700 [candidate division TM6 bacterium RIFCSPHIGHO2_12_FULL_32_22]